MSALLACQANVRLVMTVPATASPIVDESKTTGQQIRRPSYYQSSGPTWLCNGNSTDFCCRTRRPHRLSRLRPFHFLNFPVKLTVDK